MPPPLPRFRAHQQKVADARKLSRIIEETGGETAPAKASAGATSGGDWQRMRGFPIIGRGVGGTVPGTDPLAALIAKEQRQRR